MKLNKLHAALIAVALAGMGTIGYFAFANNNDTPKQQNYSDTVSSDQESSENTNDSNPLTPNEEIEQQNQNEDNSERPADDQPAKTPQVTVNEKPTIYTGYGHNQLKPLPNGQSTSTTCTTDAKVACTIVATNTSTKEKVTFDAVTTDAEGVARWSWTGGKELTSGTWELVAKAGDKSSDKETLYIQ